MVKKVLSLGECSQFLLFEFHRKLENTVWEGDIMLIWLIRDLYSNYLTAIEA